MYKRQGYAFWKEPHPPTLPQAATMLLTGNDLRFGHLWFLFMLVGLYAFVPVLARWLAAAPEREVLYFLGISLLVNTAYPLMQHFRGFTPAYNFVHFSGYAGYFVLGHWLGRKTFSLPRKTLVLLSAAGLLAGWLFTAYATAHFTRQAGQPDLFWYDYMRPNVVLMAFCVFLLFREVFTAPVGNLTALLDANSFGIYLSHLLILRLLTLHLHLNYATLWPGVGVLLHAAATVAIGLGLNLLLRQTRLTAWLAG